MATTQATDSATGASAAAHSDTGGQQSMERPSDDSVFVVVSELTKTYGSREVIAQVSFTLHPGEFLSLLGPSGSGKTTILRMIAGLAQPDRGLIKIDDRVVFDERANIPTEDRRLGMVFQDFALWPHMTVEQNITFGLGLRHMPRAERRARVGEMLALVNLMGMERRYPNQLSGGQQQRVALARALATRPALLLLDEPLSSLDTGLREVMREELTRIFRQTGTTVINVTHDQDEAMTMSDRILLLRAGKVEQFGAPAELYAQPRTAFVGAFMGPANVLRGVVSERRDETMALAVGGLTLLGRRPQGLEARVGEPGALLCRLEHVRLFQAAPTEAERQANTLEGVVTRATFAKGRWRLVARTANALEIAAESAQPIQEGATVWIQLPSDALLGVVPDDFNIYGADAPHEPTTIVVS